MYDWGWANEEEEGPETEKIFEICQSFKPSLLQEIPIPGMEAGSSVFLHHRQILYYLSHQGRSH